MHTINKLNNYAITLLLMTSILLVCNSLPFTLQRYELLLIDLVLNKKKKVITSFELVCPTFSNMVILHGIMYRQSLEIWENLHEIAKIGN